MSGAKGQAAQKHSPAQAKTPDLRYVTERRMKSGKVYAYWIRRGYETVTLPGDKTDPKAQEIATELNNPAKGIPNIKTEPRQQVWSMQDEAQFLKHADDDMMCLAFLLGAYTAQRQADILKMTWDDYDETNNRIIVRQNKTGANVSIPVHSILQKALKQAARNGETVLTTNKGGQFGVDYFSHRWLNASKNAKIDGLRFQDLRRTAIVRMGEAGSTVPEIAAVSGHTISSAHQILRTYLPTNENMAVRAIRKWEKAEESERELAEKGDRKSREGTFRKSEKMTAQKPLKRITNLARKDR